MVHSITTQQKNHVSANTRQHIGSVCGGIHGQKKGPSAFSDPFQCVSSYKEDPQLRLQSGPCRRLLSHALRDEAKWQTQVKTFFLYYPMSRPISHAFHQVDKQGPNAASGFHFFSQGEGNTVNASKTSVMKHCSLIQWSSRLQQSLGSAIFPKILVATQSNQSDVHCPIWQNIKAKVEGIPASSMTCLTIVKSMVSLPTYAMVLANFYPFQSRNPAASAPMCKEALNSGCEFQQPWCHP